MKFLENIPPYLFFTGKGGVGKTSISCATAIRLAEQGKRVLLVSTDPASNVGQVFGQTIGNTIQPITSVHRGFRCIQQHHQTGKNQETGEQPQQEVAIEPLTDVNTDWGQGYGHK